MIGEFIESWPLFWQTYIASILMALVMSWLGVLVVTRNQVFIAAAIAQASLFGLALSLFMGFTYPILLVLLMSITSSILIGSGSHVANNTSEERTSWVFLLASCGSVLLLANQPNGLRQLQSAMASTIIGVTDIDVWLFAAFSIIALILVLALHRPLALLIADPVMAISVGMRFGLWILIISVSLGIVTGLAIRSSGMLFTFGCLVLPALAARNFCKEIRTMFLISPIVATSSVILGLLIAHSRDLPPGQTIVVIQAVVLLCSWIWKEIRTSLALSLSNIS